MIQWSVKILLVHPTEFMKSSRLTISAECACKQRNYEKIRRGGSDNWLFNARRPENDVRKAKRNGIKVKNFIVRISGEVGDYRGFIDGKVVGA